MEDEVSQLREAVEQMRTSLNSQPSRTFNILTRQLLFQFSEELSARTYMNFVSNYKTAAPLNGWTEENLALGLSLYLDHTSTWFKTLPTLLDLDLQSPTKVLVCLRNFGKYISDHPPPPPPPMLFMVSFLVSNIVWWGVGVIFQ